MKIVEKIKDVVEHTADSWQQKLLNEYNHGDEPATRARKIISELVRPLDKPNQVIINDVISLIYALATNPDSSIDLDQVVSTAQLLIHELVEPIPNPDKRLMDELLNVVVHAARTPHRIAANNTTLQQQNQTLQNNSTPQNPAQSTRSSINSQPNPIPQPAAQQPIVNNQATSTKTSSQQPTSNLTSASSSSSSGSPEPTMIKLIMDEMKEVIKKNQLTEQRLAEAESRLTARISSTFEDIQNIKDKQKKQEGELETINKNLDKFISLYEIVINQYNPFIEHIDEPKNNAQAPQTLTTKNSEQKPAINTPSTQTQTTAPQISQSTPSQSNPNSVATNAQTERNKNDDLSFLIEEVKKMSEPEFAANKEKMSNWIKGTLKDEALAQSYLATQNQQEAVKLLLKKSFTAHMG